MGKYLLIGVSSAKDGRDAEYTEWYDTTHIRDICALRGVTSGRRYEATPFGFTPTPGKYLSTFEIETDDIEGVLTEMRRRSGAGEIAMTDAIDGSTAQLWIYKLP